MDTPAEKRCNKCDTVKSLHNEFYKDSGKKDGYSSICKLCANSNNNKYNSTHKEPIATYKHGWYLDHKAETYPKQRARVLENYESTIEYLRKYHQEKWPKIYEKNLEWQANHPELMKAMASRKGRKRRARRLGLPLPKQERFTIKEIADRDRWICHLCHKVVPQRKLRRNHPLGPTLDHLDPDGPHSPLNVALAHRRCNSSRGRGRTPAQLRLLP
jgi:hypothetical protein